VAEPPASLTIVPRSAQPVVPWRNGGGTTREVAAEPRLPRAGDAFAWRLSVARVAADGPFSLFPGVDRTLWLLAGHGMHLEVDGRDVRLDQPYARLEFPGEARVHARLLHGPTEDLNLMVDRARVKAEARIEHLGAGESASDTASGPGHQVWLALKNQVILTLANQPAVTLAEGDVAWVRTDSPRTWHISAPAGAVVVIARMCQTPFCDRAK
jgi:environmental stress-induced protein Ves